MIGWMRIAEAVDGKCSGIFSIPRVVEVKDGHIYFRVHPYADNIFSRKIDSPEEADDAGYKISLDMEDTESVGIGGYWIFRRGCHIFADRSNVFGAHTDYRMQFMTPELREGYHLDIYVDRNLIEIFVNQGEYVLSNVVYDLAGGIQADLAGGYEIYTMEA